MWMRRKIQAGPVDIWEVSSARLMQCGLDPQIVRHQLSEALWSQSLHSASRGPNAYLRTVDCLSSRVRILSRARFG